MLSLHPQKGRFRRIDNFLPRADGSFASRPGAVQIVAGAIQHAKEWGNRIVAIVNGRLGLWADGQWFDLDQQGLCLSVASYQVLIGGGQREDRLYLADGINPLSYIVKEGSAYRRKRVVNTVLDESGEPYPLPIPRLIAVFQNRLWINDGTNRVQHCENERPDQFDPLFTLEFQGNLQGGVRAMVAHGEVLIVATDYGLWQIAGTSQYNWAVSEVLPGLGVRGDAALCSDGEMFAFVSRQGVHLGGAAAISEDLRELFVSAQFGAQVGIATKYRLLLLALAGRLFVMHLDNPGRFAEIVQSGGLTGFVVLPDYLGWYGPSGLWLMALIPGDLGLGAAHLPVTCIMESWDDQPNLDGAGRALLNRVRWQVAGLPGSVASYLVTVDGRPGCLVEITLTNACVAAEYPPVPVWREVSIKRAGRFFCHRLTAQNYIEIKQFLPEYRFGLPK